MEHIIGIGEYAVTADRNDILKTFSLGTCVGLVVYSKTNKVMGMAHIALPDSGINADDALSNPARYADRAVDHLLDEMRFRYGCSLTDLEAAVIGGFENRGMDKLRIGERNVREVKSRLEDLGVAYNASQTGGYSSRTVVAYVDNGAVEIMSYPMLQL